MYIVAILYCQLVSTRLSCAENPAIDDWKLSTEMHHYGNSVPSNGLLIRSLSMAFLWPCNICRLGKRYLCLCQFSWYFPLLGQHFNFLKWQMVESHMMSIVAVFLPPICPTPFVWCWNQYLSLNQMVWQVDIPLLLYWCWPWELEHWAIPCPFLLRCSWIWWICSIWRMVWALCMNLLWYFWSSFICLCSLAPFHLRIIL